MSQDNAASTATAQEFPQRLTSQIYDAIMLGLLLRHVNNDIATADKIAKPHDRQLLREQRNKIERLLSETAAYTLEGMAMQTECITRQPISRILPEYAANTAERASRRVMLSLLSMNCDVYRPQTDAAEGFDPERFIMVSDDAGQHYALTHSYTSAETFFIRQGRQYDMLDHHAAELEALRTTFRTGGKFTEAMLRHALISQHRVLYFTPSGDCMPDPKMTPYQRQLLGVSK